MYAPSWYYLVAFLHVMGHFRHQPRGDDDHDFFKSHKIALMFTLYCKIMFTHHTELKCGHGMGQSSCKIPQKCRTLKHGKIVKNDCLDHRRAHMYLSPLYLELLRYQLWSGLRSYKIKDGGLFNHTRENLLFCCFHFLVQTDKWNKWNLTLSSLLFTQLPKFKLNNFVEILWSWFMYGKKDNDTQRNY